LHSNWDNHDTRVERGRIDAYARANTIWKKMLVEYEQPAIDVAIDEALKDYMARRKSEIHG
jgi:trimethylamine---corrinoid protein Co-methyltransferase